MSEMELGLEHPKFRQPAPIYASLCHMMLGFDPTMPDFAVFCMLRSLGPTLHRRTSLLWARSTTRYRT